MSIELAKANKLELATKSNTARTLSAANDDLVASRTRGLKLNLSNYSSLGDDWQSKFSIKTFITIVAIHLSIFFGLLMLNPIEPAETITPEPTAMLVSLVSEPAPEPAPEVVEIIPEPKPVIKKPKPVKQMAEPTPIAESVPEQTEAVSEPEVINPVPTTAAPVVAKQEAPVIKEAPVVQEVVEPPRFGAAYLHNPPPSYPAISRRLGEEGRVMLRVLVSKDGSAEQVEIETGSGFARLDKAAQDAVKNWRFIPAKRSNQPISAYVIVPIQFTLNS